MYVAWAARYLFQDRTYRLLTMKIISKFGQVSLILALGISLVSQSAAVALPTAFEKELAQATKIDFNKPVKLGIVQCKSVLKAKKYINTCTYENFVVTVKSFTYADSAGFPDGTPRFDLALKMENYSKSASTGISVGSLLRCSNSKSISSFYADAYDPQSVPAGSQDEGTIKVSFPDDVTLQTCKSPIIWLTLSSYGADIRDLAGIAALKKKKLSAFAYIPIPSSSLSY